MRHEEILKLLCIDTTLLPNPDTHPHAVIEIFKKLYNNPVIKIDGEIIIEIMCEIFNRDPEIILNIIDY